MSDQQDTDLIVGLPDDVLWRIFTLNANIDNFDSRDHNDQMSPKLHPLNTARHTSQVCRQWREIIIGSSSIWAGLIDFDLLESEKEGFWMDEVMRRTGQSFLSVIGQVGEGPAPRWLFFALLTDHWPRIRNFNISFQNPSQADITLWDVFWDRPAPHIESFNFHYFTDSDQPLIPWEPRRTALFSNDAPALRVFHCVQFGLVYPASWISQLRSITLSSQVTVQQALDVLSQAQSLEKLVFTAVQNTTPLPPGQPRINLRRLHQIRAVDTPKTSIAFFEHIIPAAACKLDFELQRDWDPAPINVSRERIQALYLLISRYVESYFRSTNVDACCLTISSANSFDLSMSHNGCTEDNPPAFEIGVPVDHVFPVNHLGTITKFDFVPPGGAITFYTFQIGALYTFILSLTSVTILGLSHHALALITKISPQNTRLFPSLTHVKLRHTPGSQGSPSEDPLLSFLTHKKNAGSPVVLLDISEWLAVERILDWAFLEQMEGLAVVWSTKGADEQYICGSGNPQRLDFRR